LFAALVLPSIHRWYNAPLPKGLPKLQTVIPLIRSNSFRPPPAIPNLESVDGGERRSGVMGIGLGGGEGQGQTQSINENTAF